MCFIVAASSIFVEFRINRLNMTNMLNVCLCAKEWLKLKKAPSRHAD